MSRAQVELDFFSMVNEKERQSSLRQPQQQHRLVDRRRSFRGIQNAISKISPEVLKSLIASGSTNGSTSKSSDHGSFAAPPPVYSLPPRQHHPVFGSTCEEETAPMTIFYNGTICVFDLPPRKAESIMKFAMEGGFRIEEADHKTAASSSQEKDLLGALDAGRDKSNPSAPVIFQVKYQQHPSLDLPIVWRKSLHRFFEKRKERLISMSPYYHVDHANGKTMA